MSKTATGGVLTSSAVGAELDVTSAGTSVGISSSTNVGSSTVGNASDIDSCPLAAESAASDCCRNACALSPLLTSASVEKMDAAVDTATLGAGLEVDIARHGARVDPAYDEVRLRTVRDGLA